MPTPKFQHNTAELMRRCEHALRTGQTQHLFPILAARTLEQIRADVQQNRRDWGRLNAASALRVMGLAWRDAARYVVQEVLGQGQPTRADFALVPAPMPTRPLILPTAMLADHPVLNQVAIPAQPLPPLEDGSR